MGSDRRSQPIGVFDSGVGGLTVLHELLVALAHEDYLYLGDTGRFPYGDREPSQIREFSIEIADELVERGAKLLVVACNSATATALVALRERYADDRISVIGVVEPESQEAVVTTRNGRVGLLATSATVKSCAYAKAVRLADPHIELTSVSCVELAGVIQQDHRIDDRVVEMVRDYCAPLIEAGVDTVILGCTHYPMVRPLLQRILGRDVKLIAPGQAIARRVERALAASGLASSRQGEGAYRFLCTGDVETFSELGTRFLQLPISNVTQVALATRDRAAIAPVECAV